MSSLKNLKMKNDQNIEFILFPRFSIKDSRQKELVKWLSTSVQYAIEKQQESTKKIFLTMLQETPAIYLS
jgi:hypothetical protein